MNQIDERLKGFAEDIISLKKDMEYLTTRPFFKLRMEIFEYFDKWEKAVLASYDSSWGGLTYDEKIEKIEIVASFLNSYSNEFYKKSMIDIEKE